MLEKLQQSVPRTRRNLHVVASIFLRIEKPCVRIRREIRLLPRRNLRVLPQQLLRAAHDVTTVDRLARKNRVLVGSRDLPDIYFIEAVIGARQD